MQELDSIQVIPNHAEKILVRHGEDAPEVYREWVQKEVVTVPSTNVAHDAVAGSEQALRQKPFWRRKRFIGAAVLVMLFVILPVVLIVRKKAPGTPDTHNPPATPSLSGSDNGHTSTPSSSVSSSNPSPTSIKQRSMLSAASFRDREKKESTIFLAYQSPNSDFQIIRYSKSDESNDGYWHKPQMLVPASAPKDLSGLGIGLVEVEGRPPSTERLQITMNVISSTNHVIQFTSETNKSDLDFGLAGGDEELGASLASYSNLAMYAEYVVLQFPDGRLYLQKTLRSIDGLGVDRYPIDAEANNGTRLAIVPLFRNHTKTLNEEAVGMFYIEQSNVLSAVASSEEFDKVFQNFPDESEILPSSSFTAFAAAGSTRDDDSVNIYVLYQDSSPDFKQVWTEDGGKRWLRSAPRALSGGDIGTSITCTSLATVDDEGSRILEPASFLTRCYFMKGGFMVEAKFDGVDWTMLGEVPLP